MRRAGLEGICGASDLRAVIDQALAGDVRGRLALDMFTYRCDASPNFFTRLLPLRPWLEATWGSHTHARELSCVFLPLHIAAA